jgi:hypothetical protein
LTCSYLIIFKKKNQKKKKTYLKKKKRERKKEKEKLGVAESTPVFSLFFLNKNKKFN